MYKNIENIFYQIKNELLNSADIKKLIFYNDPSALSKPEPSREEVSSRIYVRPIIFIDNDAEVADTGTFISIGMVESIIDYTSFQSSIKISIGVNRETWELDNYRIRPMAILSEVIDRIAYKKYNAAGKLLPKVVQEVFYSTNVTGYVLLLDIDEETGDVVDEF